MLICCALLGPLPPEPACRPQREAVGASAANPRASTEAAPPLQHRLVAAAAQAPEPATARSPQGHRARIGSKLEHPMETLDRHGERERERERERAKEREREGE